MWMSAQDLVEAHLLSQALAAQIHYPQIHSQEVLQVKLNFCNNTETIIIYHLKLFLGKPHHQFLFVRQRLKSQLMVWGQGHMVCFLPFRLFSWGEWWTLFVTCPNLFLKQMENTWDHLHLTLTRKGPRYQLSSNFLLKIMLHIPMAIQYGGIRAVKSWLHPIKVWKSRLKVSVVFNFASWWECLCGLWFYGLASSFLFTKTFYYFIFGNNKFIHVLTYRILLKPCAYITIWYLLVAVRIPTPSTIVSSPE